MQLTPVGKVTVLVVVAGVAFGVYKSWDRIAPGAATKNVVVPTKVDLPDKGTANLGVTTTDFQVAGDAPGCTTDPEVRVLGYAWNAQQGMLLATGGPQATQGSLMCKNGVNLKWARQDDNSKLQENLVAFATALSKGDKNPAAGAQFVTVMGDGGAAFIKPLNDTLRKLGPEYQAKIVDAIGYSRGEDKFMGPVSWRENPSAAMGGTVAGVLRDGDWNIAQKWLGDNGLKTNPDEKTWDPDALNWISASDYVDAAEKYVSGYSETRPVVRNGVKTGETKTIKVDGVVTWTPGDVTIAQKKGGLVSIISTKEYSSQMPCIVIGIDKWCKANKPLVEKMITAIGEGGQQIQNDPNALKRASQIAAQVFDEKGADAAYWEKYFKGTTEKDATGEMVDLGGSSVNNLADSLLSFGQVPGSSNLVATTYTVFGNLVKSQYPELVPAIDPASNVVDGSYLRDVSLKMTGNQKALIAKAKPVYKAAKANAAPRKLVSRRQWNIQFNPGQATFTPAARAELDKLSRDLLIAGGTTIEVHGHTDSSGNPATSMPLSEARAFAVKSYLQKLSPVNFPDGRVETFAHGESQPLVPNTTPDNRAKNRRVEIVLRAS